jgi:hypothetical protein
MHKVWIVGCTTIALVTLSLAAAAQQGDEPTKRMGIKGKVITKNAFGNAYLWVTIYDTRPRTFSAKSSPTQYRSVTKGKNRPYQR